MSKRSEPRGCRILKSQIASNGIIYYVKRQDTRSIIKEFFGYRQTEGVVKKEQKKRTREFYENLIRLKEMLDQNSGCDEWICVPRSVFWQNKFLFKETDWVVDSGMDTAGLCNELSDLQMSDLFVSIFSGLKFLAMIGYVHGDIKPDNFVIEKKNDRLTAKMIDYDTGFFTDTPEPAYKINYTPEYASPEMICFQELSSPESDNSELFKSILPASDVFSAGCLMIYYLTGREPTFLQNESLIIYPGDMKYYGFPVILPDIHPVWRSLIEEMLWLDPEKRLSADQVLTAIKEAKTAGLLDRIVRTVDDTVGCNACRFQHSFKIRREGKATAEKLTFLYKGWSAVGIGGLLESWKFQNEKAKRYMSRLQRLRQIITDSDEIPSALSSFWFEGNSEIPILAQDLRVTDPEQLISVEEIYKRGQDTADAVMLELLEAVFFLQKKGVNCSLMALEDILCYEDKRGCIHPILTGLERFYLGGIDSTEMYEVVSMEILAPEVYIFLGDRERAGDEEAQECGDERSCIYSLGAVYHCLLTGGLPSYANDSYSCLAEASLGDENNQNCIFTARSLDPQRRQIITDMLEVTVPSRLSCCIEAVKRIRFAAGLPFEEWNLYPEAKELDFKEDDLELDEGNLTPDEIMKLRDLKYAQENKEEDVYREQEESPLAKDCPFFDMHVKLDLHSIDKLMLNIIDACDRVHKENNLYLCLAPWDIQINTDTLEIAINGGLKGRIDKKMVGLPDLKSLILGVGEMRTEGKVGAYLPPEIEGWITYGEGDICMQTEVFCLGLLYHILLCGELPETESSYGGWYSNFEKIRIRNEQEDKLYFLDESKTIGAVPVGNFFSDRNWLLNKALKAKPGDRCSFGAMRLRLEKLVKLEKR